MTRINTHARHTAILVAIAENSIKVIRSSQGKLITVIASMHARVAIKDCADRDHTFELCDVSFSKQNIVRAAAPKPLETPDDLDTYNGHAKY